MVLSVRNRAGLFGHFCRGCAATLAVIRDELERPRSASEYKIRGTHGRVLRDAPHDVGEPNEDEVAA
jgi:hypothetical protein